LVSFLPAWHCYRGCRHNNSLPMANINASRRGHLTWRMRFCRNSRVRHIQEQEDTLRFHVSSCELVLYWLCAFVVMMTCRWIQVEKRSQTANLPVGLVGIKLFPFASIVLSIPFLLWQAYSRSRQSFYLLRLSDHSGS